MKINMRMYWLQKEGPKDEDLPEIWEVLKKIKKSLGISTRSKRTSRFSLDIESAVDLNILEQLESTERILKKVKNSNNITTSPSIVLIEVNEKKFESFYRKIADRVEKLEKEKRPAKLYLTPEGDLYREPKKKYCYSMDENSDRHKIVRNLASNKGYQLTKQISLNLEGKDEKSIRKEISKINDLAKSKLFIKDKLIQGKKGSGYRINPKYRVIPKNE